MGQCWEVASRFLWQTPQTLAGFALSQFANASEWLGFTNGGIQSISYLYGATAVTYNVGGWGAITLGSFINGDNQLRADPCNHLFQHEYGHYIQSQEMGLAYLGRVGIPSGLNGLTHDASAHNVYPIEVDANRRAFLYFNKYIDGFYTSGEDNNLNQRWNFAENPLYKDYKGFVDYHDPIKMAEIKNMLIHANPIDYAAWLLPPVFVTDTWPIPNFIYSRTIVWGTLLWLYYEP